MRVTEGVLRDREDVNGVRGGIESVKEGVE